MSNAEQIQEIELNIQEAQEIIEMANLLDKLEQNRAFKKLILEGYMEKEAVRLTMLMAHPNLQEKDKQEAIVQELRGISSLNSYFNTVRYRASMATKAVEANREELTELYKEADE